MGRPFAQSLADNALQIDPDRTQLQVMSISPFTATAVPAIFLVSPSDCGALTVTPRRGTIWGRNPILRCATGIGVLPDL